MSGRGLRVAVAVAVAAAALAGVAMSSSLHSGQREARGGFTLRGHVGGLYPGARRRLVVVVRNRGRRALRIRSITTLVRPAVPAAARETCACRPFAGGLSSGRAARGAWRYACGCS